MSLKLLIAAAATVLTAGAASATVVGIPASDTVDATTGQPNTYFLPEGALYSDSPYYRPGHQDWGWTHGALTGAIDSATLYVSGYDVDSPDEIDVIEIFDATNNMWVTLGMMTGTNEEFTFSEFILGSQYFDEIASGLQVRVNIDADMGGWWLTLAKSVLTINGAAPGSPEPGASAVPLPAAGWMLIAGLGALGAARRRKKA